MQLNFTRTRFSVKPTFEHVAEGEPAASEHGNLGMRSFAAAKLRLLGLASKLRKHKCRHTLLNPDDDTCKVRCCTGVYL